MEGAEFIKTPQWSLEPIFGYKHPLLTINSEKVVHTWIILGLLCLILILVHYLLKYSRIGKFLVLEYVSFFIDLTTQTLGTFNFSHFTFTTSLFTFILLCNIASLIPGMIEPTTDLNTTLALGIISFFYIQTTTIRAQGIGPYIKDFFQPLFILFPLNIVGKLSSIVSISFRLFGNVFGGSIISHIYFSTLHGSIFFELLGMLSGVNFLIMIFFTVFEGFLQAFVFAMITLTYLSIGMQKESD